MKSYSFHSPASIFEPGAENFQGGCQYLRQGWRIRSPVRILHTPVRKFRTPVRIFPTPVRKFWNIWHCIRPRVVFSSRMKPSIHLAILWREILPIVLSIFISAWLCQQSSWNRNSSVVCPLSVCLWRWLFLNLLHGFLSSLVLTSLGSYPVRFFNLKKK